jgi:hypothetical protein
MAAFSDVEASVRASSDMAADTGRTPQATILVLANEEYEEVIRRLAEFMPDPYRAVSADLSVSATTSPYIDVASLTGAFRFLEIQRKESGKYWTIDPADGKNPEVDPKLTWRQRGFFGTGAKLDIFPPESSVGTYRVHYCVFPGALTVSPDAELKLPLGGRKYLAACVAARIKHREEEDPTFMESIRSAAFSSLRIGLEPKGGTIGTRGRY